MLAVVPRLFALVLVCGACLYGLPRDGMAQSPIYHWTDETGRVIYSDTPPAADQGAVKLQMPAAPSEEDAAAARQRSEALSKQADEFASERLEREQRAAEAAKQNAVPVKSNDDSDEDGDNYYPYYGNQYPSYGARPERPDRRPIVQPGDRPLRPVQPIARPIRNR